MPREIRQLITDLKKSGFFDRGGKGSHRNFVHPSGVTVTLSGKEGDEAAHYKEKNIKKAIMEVTQ